MPNIKDLRKEEMEKIVDFYCHIEEYGHTFYGDNFELEGSFQKIMEGIDEIRAIQEEYYSY